MIHSFSTEITNKISVHIGLWKRDAEYQREKRASMTPQERSEYNARRRERYAANADQRRKAQESARAYAKNNRQAYNASAVRSYANRAKRERARVMAVAELHMRPHTMASIQSLTSGFAHLDELAEMWFD